MFCGWEGNRGSGVAQGMRHRLKWYNRIGPTFTVTQPEDVDERLAHGCAGLIYKVDLAYQPDGRLAVDAYAD